MRVHAVALAVLLTFSVASQARLKCRAEVASPARGAFTELSLEPDEITGEGWRTCDVSDRNLLDRLKHRGRFVALLMKDGRFAGGERLVEGYLYEIQVERLPTIPMERYLATLTPAQQAQARRGRLFGPETRYAPVKTTLVVSTQAPRFELDASEGLTRWVSRGWSRRPAASRLIRLKADSVIEAKFYLP